MTRLLSSEWLRLRSRRLVRVLVAIFLLIWVVVVVANFATHAKSDNPQQLFKAAEMLPEAARFVGGGALAVLAYVLGASYSGADWQTGTMQALLFWEPRRVRVMLARAIVLVVGVVLLGIVALAYALPGLYFVASQRGTTAGVDPDLWREMATHGGRGLAVAVFAGLLGFAVASLTRNTGGALGAGFVWFAILEQLISGVRPGLTPYLLVPNIAAWLEGSHSYRNAADTISRAHGGFMLVLYATLAVGLATALFARRDVT